MKHALFLTPLLIGSLLAPGCSDQPDPAGSSAPVPAWESGGDAVSLPNDFLDGWIDTEYRFANVDPAYAEGSGPNICVDEAHFNLHTAGGIFKPFAELLRGDGYRVTPFRYHFKAGVLTNCQILLIANAQARANIIGFDLPESNWAYPHASAFSREEIDQVILWVRGGGALLLIADHAPLSAAVSDLALLLGVHMFDGYALVSAEEKTAFVAFGTVREEIWREANRVLTGLIDLDFNARYQPILANPGALAPHPVVKGRNQQESIKWIVTYGGQAFLTSDDWMPITVFGPDAVSVAPLAFNFEDTEWFDGPLFSVAGWLNAATRRLNLGRVVVLGEGGMCTAQFDDLDGEIEDPLEPYGFNAPHAPYNAQYCLNVVHWLSGLLDE